MNENNLKILAQELCDPFYAGKTAEQAFAFTCLRSAKVFAERFSAKRCDELRKVCGIASHAEHRLHDDDGKPFPPLEAGFPNAITQEEFDAAWKIARRA